VRAMQKDFGWQQAAMRYADVYGWAVQKKRGTAFAVTSSKPERPARSLRN
jgi:hypothetical protein